MIFSQSASNELTTKITTQQKVQANEKAENWQFNRRTRLIIQPQRKIKTTTKHEADKEEGN